MPYKNEHSARLLEPEQFKKYRRTEIDTGISFIYGIKSRHAYVQAIRFNKDVFTVIEALRWLRQREIVPILFEKANG